MSKRTLYLFNTLSREKEAALPEDHQILLYTCGPTVYDYSHIGNLRTFLFEDLLKRTLEYFGFSVKHAMNLTDVDDKTIEGAIKEGVELNAFTKKYIEAFFEDLLHLRIQKANFYPQATEYIPQMISLIEDLMEKGFAYPGKDGNIYFSIKSFPSYGKLSHFDISQLKMGASERLTNDEYEKDDLADFVLWKKYKEERDGPIFWESPFGKGRPGWHIECSAMATKVLGKTIDIHCGGVDNIFPHHENEIAQCEGSTGQTFARIWAHSEHLVVEGKKMSKSLGNFYTLRDLMEKGYDPVDIRQMLLQTHYRMKLNFTFQELEAVKAARERVRDFVYRISHLPEKEEHFPLEDLLEKHQQGFEESLADDLNISAAFGQLFQLIKEVHLLCDEKKLGREEGEKIYMLLQDWNLVFATLPIEKKEDIPEEVKKLAQEREQARKEKNFPLSDTLRDEIISRGYKIEDTPTGYLLKKD